MHIVQLIPELNQGGVERGVVEFNRELVLRGHTSTVISNGGKLAAQIEADGGRHLQINLCSKNPHTFPIRACQLSTALAQLKPDILHARSRVPAWLAVFANNRLNIPFVTTVHGFNSVSHYSAVMTRGKRVIYGSSAIKDYILKNYRIEESILRYVPRGIDMDYFNPETLDHHFIETFKKKHDLNGRHIISVVGRITEWKGHDVFIRALAIAQKQNPNIIGVVAGGVWHNKNDHLQTLETLARETGADIRFTGSQTNVREIHALSDLVVSAASTKPETFGRVAAEALAMNTPVIASAHGGSLDILLDGENGFLFEPQNHEKLAEKTLQATDYSFTNMREHIQQNFSLEHMTETELDVYRELITD